MAYRTFPAAARARVHPAERPARTAQTGWSRRSGWVALVAKLAVAGLGLGGSPTHAQVLHEPVVVPELRCQDRTCRRDGASTESLPEAVMSSEGLIGAPQDARSPEKNEKDLRE